MTTTRRRRGELEAAVIQTIDAHLAGKSAVPAGDPLTAHHIALSIGRRTGNAPSAGAVSYVLERWRRIGYATFSDRPMAFTGYTEEAGSLGLEALVARHKADRSALPPIYGPPDPPRRQHRRVIAGTRIAAAPPPRRPVHIQRHYSTPEVADLFAVTTETVRRWITDGRIQAIRINGHWRVPQRSLEELASS